MSWTHWAERELHSLHEAQRLRRTFMFDGDGVHASVGGRRVVSFASNDYLNLSCHPDVIAAAQAALHTFGAGATASRLIVGTRSVHEALQIELARWKAAEAALVFASGYAANMGVITTLGAADATIFSDALNHASIIDGCRLAKARTVVYRHGDLNHLEAALNQHSGRKIVVTETVFSMDGDRIDVGSLARLCAQHEALLITDEAHDVFEFAPSASASVEHLRVGTLSKTLGAMGGFVAGPRALIDLLLNRARTFVFSTGLSPADTAAALYALRLCTAREGEQRRAALRAAVDVLSPSHPSAVVPIILGEDRRALAAQKLLVERGFYAPAIRPPTVPEGAARLRVSLSAAHTPAMVEELRAALADVLAGRECA